MTRTWLKENITPLLALIWSVSAIAVIIIILLKPLRADEKITYQVIGFINSVVMFILGYYYGSNKAMNEKMKTDYQNKNNTTQNEKT